MTRIIYILLIILVGNNCFGQTNGELKSIFLDIDYSNKITKLFDDIGNNPKFKLMTSRESFLRTADFQAKYLSKKGIQIDCDSVICHVYSCDDVSTFFKPEAKNCKVVKINYYFTTSRMMETNFSKLDSLVNATVLAAYPDWKNRDGAAKGVYFLTANFYPFITIDKHLTSENYLSISYNAYDK